ncbi:histone-like nucleoid-structuring protein, MvaT/MvaU family (plasmid) [Pseudomonas sp. FeN3W]|nr:histone-like nucleoid-structuring protein, MvaT/MvaU family [Pseudomonas sp. FeN3W]
MNIKKIAEYRELQAKLEQMQKDRDQLAPEVSVAIQFLEKVEAEAKELGLSLVEVALYLAPELKVGAPEKTAKQRKPHKPREMKVYVNPNTQERIETKGGNHKLLKQWKAEHGGDVVEGWREVDTEGEKEVA